MNQTITVIGAGTMGSGIAQVAAQHGFSTRLFDVNPAIVDKAKKQLDKTLSTLCEKQKISLEEKDRITNSIDFISDIQLCKSDIIIEAIVELPAAKISLFNQLSDINGPGTIFASNTSSLSISALQKSITNPERVVGMHFFNPAPLMKLVEVVKGELTNDQTVQAIHTLCLNMKKTPVHCKDAPGFIVNRVARHYYLEAMKTVDSGIARIEEVDEVMESSGFKMGPFKLMDLIGMDVNLAVSKSIYEAFDEAVRFKPSALQIDKVEKGELGKKTGKGFYRY